MRKWDKYTHHDLMKEKKKCDENGKDMRPLGYIENRGGP